LQQIAVWHAFNGAIAVLDGNGSGWADLHLSVEYRIASARLRIPARLPLDYKLEFPDELTKFSLALAASLAFESWDSATRLGNRMQGAVRDGALGSWKHLPLATFVLALWARANNLEVLAPDGLLAPLGPYGPLLDSTASREEVRRAVAAACDYHLEETTLRDAELHSGAFAAGPYDVWPVEVQAWWTVSRRMGAEPTMVDHPLLQTKLGAGPPVLAREGARDDLLNAVLSAEGVHPNW
jgi:hypothetical protein